MEPLPTAGNAMCIRPATKADIPFVAAMMVEACKAPLNHCDFDEMVDDFGLKSVDLMRGMLQSRASAWGSIEDAFILEEGGVPVASSFLYVPSAEGHAPIRTTRLSELGEAMGLHGEDLSTLATRVRAMFPDTLSSAFAPQAEAIIEYVAVAAEARGKGRIKILLQAIITEAKTRGIGSLGIMVVNGNDRARRTYESLGFQPYDAYYSAYFEAVLPGFPGLTRFRLPLATAR